MRRASAVAVLACLSCGSRTAGLGDTDGTAPDPDTSGVGEAGDGGSSGEPPTLDVGGEPWQPQLDILFVVDNSFSMRHETRNVARNMSGIWDELSALQDIDGDALLPEFDVHMMVTTTDVGGPHCSGPDGYEATGGTPLTSGCNARAAEFVRDGVDVFDACTQVCPTDVVPDGEFIHLEVGGASNVPGDDVGAALACLGTQGISGCEYAQPLEAMLRALSPSAPWNLGPDPFLRERSLAVVVLISDAPDCSLADPLIFIDESLMEIDPDSGAPKLSPAVCWNAGVSCTESGTPGLYEDCAPAGAGLLPVDRYVSFLHEELNQAQDRDVLMLAALGVPEVYAHDELPPFEPTGGGVFDLVYRDWKDGVWPFGDVIPSEDTTAAEQQWFNGIGPGCTGEDGMGGFTGQAMPPVRALDVCQSLDGEGDAGIRCCIESICDREFSVMMRCLDAVRLCPVSGGTGERCELG